jgi:hypothetical protein
MKALKLLGACLVTVLALSAVAAGSASAKTSVWTKFQQCPIHYPVPPGFGAGERCIYGEAGKESFFQAGRVTVKFEKKIILQGGFTENESGEQLFLPALNRETISKKAEPAPSLTEGLDPEVLEEPEKKRYEEYLGSGGSTKVTATIELAKPATDILLNEANLLLESGPSFGFPVEIRLTNRFLGKYCYVGSFSEPIEVPFTTGETAPEPPNTPIHGKLGKLKEGQILEVHEVSLVNNEYAAPGVHGCGVEGGADAALNTGLGLPSPAGSNTTELNGNLFQAGTEAVEEHLKV